MNCSSDSLTSTFVSRGGEKLFAALQAFHIDAANLACADLGSHVGGFVDCLLQAGAQKVFSVDTSYGTLAWRLRKDARVIVLERTNAMHVALPEMVDLVTVDVGWTPQAKVLPNARRLVKESGSVIILVKPQYESPPRMLVGGILPDSQTELILEQVAATAKAYGFIVCRVMESPLRGHGGNREFLMHLIPATCPAKAPGDLS